MRCLILQVRRDSMPPAFTLPEEVTRAVEEPLPKLRSVALEEKVGKEGDSFDLSSVFLCWFS